jgi:hypothetical protein
MTFLNPWAWIGLAALALPILIHLIGRGRPTVIPFPTLRFLTATREQPVRRRRLQDIPLLLLRLAVFAVAVAALAQPLASWLPGGAGDRGVSRAIVVDTSASMARATTDGRTAAAIAEDLATAATQDAGISRRVDAAAIEAGVNTGVAWLLERPSPRELVVISDFARGAIDASALAAVPDDIGIELQRAGVPATARAAEFQTTSAEGTRRAVVTPADSVTSVAWLQNSSGVRAGLPQFLTISAGSDRAADVDRMIRAVRDIGMPAGNAGRPVRVVFAGAPAESSLRASARPLDRPWMFDVMAGVEQDETTKALMGDTPAPLEWAATGDGEGAAVTIFVPASVTRAAGAAIVAAAWRHASSAAATSPGEWESVPMDDAALRALERTPDPSAAAGAAPDESGSQGRWLWALVLLLLGVETVVRRTQSPGADTSQEAPRARVA